MQLQQLQKILLKWQFLWLSMKKQYKSNFGCLSPSVHLVRRRALTLYLRLRISVDVFAHQHWNAAPLCRRDKIFGHFL